MSTILKTAVRTLDESFSKLLDSDTNAEHITQAMRTDSPIAPGPDLVPTARYISREYHELEKKNLWSRVWQMAAHEDDFPNIGDAVPYDIVDKSYLLVRVTEDEYKAYYNACLHRGRKLRESRAKGLDEIRCAFHGWCWELDGALKQVPCAYDYSDLNRDEEFLPEVKIGRWGRYLFINPDPDCESLEDFIGDLSTQFEIFPYERRYKQAHVAKTIRANWKVAQEAFMESYHVFMTHPQALAHGAHDNDTKYDVFGNYSRAMLCGALDGAGIPDWGEPPEQADGVTRVRHPLTGTIYESSGDDTVQVTTSDGLSGKFTRLATWMEGDPIDANPHMCIMVAGVQLPDSNGATEVEVGPEHMALAIEKLGENATPRALRGEMQRSVLREIIPSVADTIPDIELSAAIYLTLFPNFHPWGSFNRINYRFRPNGDNHEECLMECMYMAPIPDDGNYTPVSEIHYLGIDEDWTNAPELGNLGGVFNQDVRNMAFVFDGMKASARDFVRLADYNETKIRHFHQLYGTWVDETES
jgi:phenylpropionate dioxygenase-like ring-hydroxylating dioxygenase large terminal subunit